ncbi:MAG: hypothetical protein AABX74_01250 [Nanoarchaeota archaeon]
MDKRGKSAIVFGLTVVIALTIFAVVGIAHLNPQGKQTHPVGLETESCQDALAGAEEQLADRGSINPRLLDNIEDKCGVECSIEFDAAHEPVLVCGETEETCITRVECSERGEGWAIHPIDKELCESGLACGIAATFDCLCPLE